MSRTKPKESDIKSFQDSLERLIAKYGRGSAAVFADLVGVSYETVRTWRKAANIPDAAHLLLIKEKCEITLDEILSGDSNHILKGGDVVSEHEASPISRKILSDVRFILQKGNGAQLAALQAAVKGVKMVIDKEDQMIDLLTDMRNDIRELRSGSGEKSATPAPKKKPESRKVE
jgi:transcriptional regulator with XRE-family HTH domain